MITFRLWMLVSILLIAHASVAKDALRTAEADLVNSRGEKIGTAFFTETRSGINININASNLPPGEHGIHFHEMGTCTPPKFESAGQHLNPNKREHGLKNPNGPHVGDLPNLKVNDSGTVHTEMTTSRVTLASGKNSLFKKGGTALVIHSNPDDQVTQPSGASGDRIACGVITLKPQDPTYSDPSN